MEQVLQQVAENVEKQLDNEIERLDALDRSDLEAIRRQRLAEMMKLAKQKQEWIANGHGEYTEVTSEPEFFALCKKSDKMVCHFYRNDAPRCRIFDMHLQQLAPKHLETKFLKIDAERAPFLMERLRIRVIPTLVLVKKGRAKSFMRGFADFGNREDFSTEMLEWAIARRAEVIEYSGDLTTPPEAARAAARTQLLRKKTVRGRDHDSDSDLDLSD